MSRTMSRVWASIRICRAGFEELAPHGRQQRLAALALGGVQALKDQAHAVIAAHAHEVGANCAWPESRPRTLFMALLCEAE